MDDPAIITLMQGLQHELRTPIHGLLGILDELKSDVRAAQFKSKPERKAALMKLERLTGLGERLENVLEDFRDYSSAILHPSPPADAEPAPLALSDFIGDVATDAWARQVRAIRADGGDDLDLPPPPELILQSDASLEGSLFRLPASNLQRLVLKLISNALRFTDQGFVEVTLSQARPEQIANVDLDGPKHLMGMDGDIEYIQLVVEDTGEGMSEEFIADHLFRPFGKADQFRAGAGLSMSVCTSLVERLSGNLRVSSDRDRGTIITVVFPAVKCGERPSPLAGYKDRPPMLVYLWGFDGQGLERLAQVISTQLALYGNIFATSHIQDADYIILPEESAEDVSGGIEEILSKAKDGVLIGVLQSQEDTGVRQGAMQNGSRPPTYVVRKPFGPREVLELVRLAAQAGKARDHRSSEEVSRSVSSAADVVARVEAADATLEEARDVGISEDKKEATPEPDLRKVAPLEERNLEQGSSIGTREKLADNVFAPHCVDEVLTAPIPVLNRLPPPKSELRDKSDVEESDADESEERQKKRDHTNSDMADDRKSDNKDEEDGKEFSVLVVEDNLLNLRILTRMLAQAGIVAHQAVNGREAVTRFELHRPSVTLLDINMPEMDGFEACKAMRRVAPSKHRIIAVTALGDDFHRRKGLECGMDDWLTKPVKMQSLRADILRWRDQWLKTGQCADKDQ